MSSRTENEELIKRLEKLRAIYDSTSKDIRKYRFYLLISVCLIVIAYFMLFYTRGFFIPVEELFEDVFLWVALVPFVVSIFFLAKAVDTEPSSEKRYFRSLFEAYELLDKYIEYHPETSGFEANYRSAIQKLFRLSKKLRSREKRSTRSEIRNEMYAKLGELGTLIQKKILFCLQEKEDLSLIQEKILDLAWNFAYPSFSKIENSTSLLENVKKEGEFKPPPTHLQEIHLKVRTSPNLFFVIKHGGALVVSIAIVLTIAMLISSLFGWSLSELASGIVGGIFALFALIESKM